MIQTTSQDGILDLAYPVREPCVILHWQVYPPPTIPMPCIQEVPRSKLGDVNRPRAQSSCCGALRQVYPPPTIPMPCIQEVPRSKLGDVNRPWAQSSCCGALRQVGRSSRCLQCWNEITCLELGAGVSSTHDPHAMHTGGPQIEIGDVNRPWAQSSCCGALRQVGRSSRCLQCWNEITCLELGAGSATGWESMHTV
ncbi:hypothetical protein VOLCADRAFT_98653 [Volvox carteri f. nagariensis]|uniref:Uncharacterized protein n=1 Tax=Volvox carteri f. nagariensis TaxID=3068 RepID=D8UFX8_VOLCA|nr:uncharacterized protein VOLCADRAFT_98653 [Volvox carteri f. nagariensis]EFJ41330.1 hypothetical protein VOLCADRAFT_98653 [Volvox carteri f. nagariensis]|eukprot:XP_002957560.1 hypothetical protein VOLCADRAFT_98653 [Volvox carteri f. nagariensis]